MDPASVVIGVVSGAASLAAMALKTSTFLLGLRDSYTNIEVLILDLASTCRAFEIAWNRIHQWASKHIHQARDSPEPIFEQLLSYSEHSKIVLDALRTDLEKVDPSAKPAWRLSPRSKARTVLHEKGLKDHGDRLDRQINTLHLLLATAQLSAPEIQEVVLDCLQPVFRKDEESAWTIVKSKASTRRPGSSTKWTAPTTRHAASSLFSRPDRNAVSEPGIQGADFNKRFDFENELVSGPVYKRVLFAHLCNMPKIREVIPDKVSEVVPELSDTKLDGDIFWQSATCEASLAPAAHWVREPQIVSSSTADDNPEDNDERTLQLREEAGTPATSMSTNLIDWSPQNIIRILQDFGGFSTGVLADLSEIRRSKDPSTLSKRSLPLGSILKQHQQVPESLKYLNAKLIMGAVTNNADIVAEALDEGAEINTRSDSGLTALQISLADSPESTPSALILLYRETKVHLQSESGEALLHLAVKFGSLPLLRRLATSVEDLRVFDGDGMTPLHVAAMGGETSLASLKQLGRIFDGTGVSPDVILDREGRSALHIAAQHGRLKHVAEFLRLGCDPSMCPTPKWGGNMQSLCSPLFLAVKKGHVDIVRCIFQDCSDLMVGLANWKHHARLSLLDCARSSPLKSRIRTVEILIAYGADWQQSWKLSDDALAFANTGASPSLLLNLIAEGCFPVQRSLDLTPSLPNLLDDSNREMALRLLFSLKSTEPEVVENTSRPHFFAHMGRGHNTSSSFAERLTLTDILLQIIERKTQPLAPEDLALSYKEHAKDAIIPASVALHADLRNLGQLYYHMDQEPLNTLPVYRGPEVKRRLAIAFGQE